MDKQIILVLLAAAGAAGAAEAQQVYRCGSTYSDERCAGGAPVAASDPASRSAAANAVRAAQVDAERAAALEKARLAQEKSAPKAIVMGAPAPPSEPMSSGKNGSAPKKGKLEQFTAVSPAPRKAADKKKGKPSS